MAKKQGNVAGARAGNTRNAPPATKTGITATTSAGEIGFLSRYRNVLIPAAIAVITWLFLSTCLNNTLTNWDDPGYISENPLIKDLSAIGDILSTSVMGNYHPLTILSYAIEYSFVRLEPWLYHFDSLLLHIITTMLVYVFVNRLTGRQIAAAITALLFGIHPMHVESVAWLAGRKDVLYGAFYMAACITYIRFVRSGESGKWKWYGLTMILFICSLLSKPVAVVLPVTLLLIDMFEGRKLERTLIMEKILPFAVSIGFGIRSVMDQAKFGALSSDNIAFTYAERLALGGYAFVTYLWKAVVPIDLACFYPYPPKPDGAAIAATYYIYPLLAIGVVVAAWRLFRRSKALTFGGLFFLANIALLLQFIPVGGAILADRYSYIPYMGLFFIAGWLVSGLFEPGGNRQLATPMLVATAVCSLIYGYLANKQCKVWYDTTSLWRNEMEQFPTTHNAYNNLGFEYFNKYNASVTPAERKLYYDSSYYLLNTAIALQPDFVNSYISLGELLRTTGNYAEARKQYYVALSIKKNDKQAEAYLGLAITYAILGLDYKAKLETYMKSNPGTGPMPNPYFDSSSFCFQKIFETRPDFAEAHSNYGNLLDINGKLDSAIAQYTIAISINPDLDDFRLNRGRAYIKANRWDDALKDFEQAIIINPAEGENYYARSLCYHHAGRKAQALQDVQKAISLGFNQVDQNYYRSLQQ